MRRIAFALVACGIAVVLGACGEEASMPAPAGLTEPLRVAYRSPGSTETVLAQFVAGALPEGTDGPVTSDPHSVQTAIYPGQAAKVVDGNVAESATAMGIRFADIGSGYWVAPVSIADPQNPGTLTWQVLLDFPWDVPAGPHTLQASGVDALGRHGPIRTTSLYMQSAIPAADLTATLSWDTDADLDLHLTAPSGVEVSAKRRNSALDPSSVDWTNGAPPGTGVLDRDSNGGCKIDSIRRESVAFQAPEPGTYLATVDMFSACGQAAANFTFEVYSKGSLLLSQRGRLLSMDADNGAGPFLRVAQFEIQ